MSGEICIPKNADGEILSPYEKATGVPLPIYQSDRVKRSSTNRHHAYFLARDFHDGSPGERAVRFARLQKSNKSLHRLFHRIIVGTEPPADDQELFNQTVLGYAGYVPRYAVDVFGGLDVVELTHQERNALRRPKVFTVEKGLGPRAEIGSFLMNYSISQEFDPDRQKEIEQFLSISPRHVKKRPELQEIKERLGFRLISQGMELAVEPLNPTYEEATRERALKVGMPVCALTVVKSVVGAHIRDYIDPLQARLSQAFGVP